MVEMETRIAVLMVCHNRRDITLKCLSSLYNQHLPLGVCFSVYLVDDGGTDGTSEAVREQFPDVKILSGDGNLYWCGGMRLAWTEASKDDYDYYFWLNDDTMLMLGAMDTLLVTASDVRKYEGRDGIIVGSCRDPKTGEHSYGGAVREKSNVLITPGDHPIQCDMMNGNIVLVPRSVFKVAGNISPEFTHTSGDNDYGLRSIKKGFKIWVAPGFQGLCSANDYAPWTDPKVPLRQRWCNLHSPKGQPPYEIYVYARRHSGFFWPMDLVKLYFRVLFPKIWKQLKSIAIIPK
jgi:GT2 family glycosyltransferase